MVCYCNIVSELCIVPVCLFANLTAIDICLMSMTIYNIDCNSLNFSSTFLFDGINNVFLICAL